ncbi:MAG: DNA alkylation repair protein [Candidatus Micrarchaeota archaeon]
MVSHKNFDCKSVLAKLKSHSNPKNIAGMARFGISTTNTLGVSMPILRKLGKQIGKNHKLANELWDSEIHEARILAGLIADPALLTEKEMEKWVNDFDSWDVCDQVCMNLFDKTVAAHKKAVEWTEREEEFVRRAGFALMAALAFHDKKANDADFERFLPFIEKYSFDSRNFVRKAVNWALRQIGKRNKNLNKKAILLAEKINKQKTKSAKWISNDALRELKGESVQKRLALK